MAFAYRRLPNVSVEEELGTMETSYSQRAFQSHIVLRNAFNSLVWNDGPSIFQPWCNIDWFPFDRCLDAISY